jgi:hypothetical protein
MSLERITKQLKRELKANPTKAGALGVLTVVAAVFWGPLLFKSDEKPKKAVAANADALVPVGATAAAVPAAATNRAPAMDWRVLARGLSADPRMKGHLPGADGKGDSPFRAKTADEENEEWFALIEELSKAEGPEARPVEPAEPLDFEQYPLQLTSTIVGGRVRTAVINGKARRVGTEIEQWNGGSMVLAKVEPRYAVVEWNGKRRELKILQSWEKPTPPAASTDTKTEREDTQREDNGALRESADSEAPAAELESAKSEAAER